MNLYFKLCRVISKADDSSQYLTGGSKKIFGLSPGTKAYTILKKSLMTVLLLVFMAYSAMLGLGLGASGISLESLAEGAAGFMIFICIFFGIYYALTTLFFSKDISSYLAMPIGEKTLLAAKLSVYFYQISTICLLIIPAVITAGLMQGYALSSLILISVLIVLCGIPASAICLLISYAIIRWTKIGKNKDRLMTIIGVLSALASIVLVYLFYSSGILGYREEGLNLDINPTASSVLSIVLSFLSPVKLLITPILKGSALVKLLCFAGVILICSLYIALIFALYAPQYTSLASQFNAGGARLRKALDKAELNKQSQKLKLGKSISKLEWMRLRRSPMMLQQYILGPIFAPLIMLIVFYFSINNALESQMSFFAIGDWLKSSEFGPYLLSFGIPIAFAYGVFSCSFGAYAVSALSLEGSDFFRIKAMPLDWKTYLFTKLKISLLLNGLLPLICYLLLMLICGFGPVLTLIYCASILLGTVLSCMLAIFCDCVSPKLDWENESQLKNRVFRIYFLMLCNSALAAVCCVPVFLLHFLLGLALITSLIIQIVLIAIVFQTIYFLFFRYGPHFLQRIEQ